jgi:hypothetical protein
MAPSAESADWIADPGDKPALVDFFYSIRGRLGQGGDWDRTALNEAASHMASRGAPKKGGPKTADSIKSQWTSVCYIPC